MVYNIINLITYVAQSSLKRETVVFEVYHIRQMSWEGKHIVSSALSYLSIQAAQQIDNFSYKHLNLTPKHIEASSLTWFMGRYIIQNHHK